jgi:hypothetical protein
VKLNLKVKLFLAATTLSLGMVLNCNLAKVVTGEAIVQGAEAKTVIIKTRGHHNHPVRRVVRSAVYISTLPHGCPKVYVNGVRYWYCGGRYYDSYNGRYVVVYVN